MRTKKQNFVRGFIDVLPLLIPVVPFGIIFGAIGIELGFGPYVTYATSIIIFSGASQIVFFQAEDGIRDPEMSRGLGDVYKRQK